MTSCLRFRKTCAKTGFVLAAMLPERHDEILARVVGEYGQSRLVGGIHDASGIEAGYRAGMATVMTKPAFQADFSKAGASCARRWAAALTLRP